MSCQWRLPHNKIGQRVRAQQKIGWLHTWTISSIEFFQKKKRRPRVWCFELPTTPWSMTSFIKEAFIFLTCIVFELRRVSRYLRNFMPVSAAITSKLSLYISRHSVWDIIGQRWRRILNTLRRLVSGIRNMLIFLDNRALSCIVCPGLGSLHSGILM